MTTNTTTTPAITTRFFMIHAPASEWLDALLGNQSAQDWVGIAEANNGGLGETLEEQSASLLEWFGQCEYIASTREGLVDILARDADSHWEVDEIRERFEGGFYDDSIHEFSAEDVVCAIYGQSGCVRLLESIICPCSGGFGEWEVHPNGYDLFDNGAIFPDAATALKAWEDVVDDDSTICLHLRAMAKHLTEGESILGRIHNEPQHVYVIRREGQESTYAALEIRPVEPRTE